MHHGGAGTTAACLRNGVVQLIAPCAWDQQYFASRIEELGAGYALQPAAKLQAVDVVPRIREALCLADLKNRAMSLARAVSARDAASDLAQQVESAVYMQYPWPTPHQREPMTPLPALWDRVEMPSTMFDIVKDSPFANDLVDVALAAFARHNSMPLNACAVFERKLSRNITQDIDMVLSRLSSSTF